MKYISLTSGVELFECLNGVLFVKILSFFHPKIYIYSSSCSLNFDSVYEILEIIHELVGKILDSWAAWDDLCQNGFEWNHIRNRTVWGYTTSCGWWYPWSHLLLLDKLTKRSIFDVFGFFLIILWSYQKRSSWILGCRKAEMHIWTNCPDCREALRIV